MSAWLSFGHQFSEQMFLLMLHLPLRRKECATGNRFNHMCTSIAAIWSKEVLCHGVITFRAVIWCLGFIRHTEMRITHCILYSLCQRKKYQVCLLTTKIFNTAFLLQGEVVLALWAERDVLWLPAVHILFWGNFWKMGNSRGWKMIQMDFIFYRKTCV